MDVCLEVDVDVIYEYLIVLCECVDGLGVVVCGVLQINESVVIQVLYLVGLVYQKLDNGEIEVGQMLELLLSIKQCVDVQQVQLDSLVV